jgi:hypothetical protein
MADGLHFRRWSPTPPHSVQKNFGPVLKLVCYNVLAESLEENTTSTLDPRISAFQWRKDRLVRELDAWNADIYCLQEVEHYADFWEPFFNSRSAIVLAPIGSSNTYLFMNVFCKADTKACFRSATATTSSTDAPSFGDQVDCASSGIDLSSSTSLLSSIAQTSRFSLTSSVSKVLAPFVAYLGPTIGRAGRLELAHSFTPCSQHARDLAVPSRQATALGSWWRPPTSCSTRSGATSSCSRPAARPTFSRRS